MGVQHVPPNVATWLREHGDLQRGHIRQLRALLQTQERIAVRQAELLGWLCEAVSSSSSAAASGSPERFLIASPRDETRSRSLTRTAHQDASSPAEIRAPSSSSVESKQASEHDTLPAEGRITVLQRSIAGNDGINQTSAQNTRAKSLDSRSRSPKDDTGQGIMRTVEGVDGGTVAMSAYPQRMTSILSLAPEPPGLEPDTEASTHDDGGPAESHAEALALPSSTTVAPSDPWSGALKDPWKGKDMKLNEDTRNAIEAAVLKYNLDDSVSEMLWKLPLEKINEIIGGADGPMVRNATAWIKVTTMNELRRSGVADTEKSRDNRRNQARKRAKSEEVSSKLDSSQEGANLKDRNQRGGRQRNRNNGGGESNVKSSTSTAEGTGREVHRVNTPPRLNSSGGVQLQPRMQGSQQGRQQLQTRQEGAGRQRARRSGE